MITEVGHVLTLLAVIFGGLAAANWKHTKAVWHDITRPLP